MFFLSPPIVHFSFATLIYAMPWHYSFVFLLFSKFSQYFFFGLLCWNFEITIWVYSKISCLTFVINLDSCWNSSINFMVSWQDVDHRDDNYDDDGLHETDLEGRVVKYVGMIMMVYMYLLSLSYVFIFRINKEVEIKKDRLDVPNWIINRFLLQYFLFIDMEKVVRLGFQLLLKNIFLHEMHANLVFICHVVF